MGIRKVIESNPAAAKVGVTVLLCAALGMLAYEILQSGNSSAQPARFQQAFFTTDDGKSFYPDDDTLIAPYSHDGKDAVRAHVFSCDGKQIVGFLERFNAAGRQALTQAQEEAKTRAPNGKYRMIASTTGHEVKRPGDAKWTSGADTKAAEAILNFKCPDGSAAEVMTP